MAADQDRASRIRDLKEHSLGLTWQAMADHVGVTMRAAQAWAEKGEIAYENAKKLAELFDDEVTVDWIMRGPETAPDLIGALEQPAQLDRIEGLLHEVLRRLPGLEEQLEQELDDALQQADAPSPNTGQSAHTQGRREASL